VKINGYILLLSSFTILCLGHGQRLNHLKGKNGPSHWLHELSALPKKFITIFGLTFTPHKPVITRAKMKDQLLRTWDKKVGTYFAIPTPLPPQSLLLVWININCGDGAGSIRPHPCFLQPYQNLKLLGQMWLRTQFSPLLFFRWSW